MAHVTLTTQGCSANMRESELMAGLLQKAGHAVRHANGAQEKEPDIHIINICTVKKDSTPLNEIKNIFSGCKTFFCRLNERIRYESLLARPPNIRKTRGGSRRQG